MRGRLLNRENGVRLLELSLTDQVREAVVGDA